MPLVRNLALILTLAFLADSPQPAKVFKISGKSKGFIQVKTQILQMSDRVKLIFSVTSNETFKNASLEWHLPEKISVLMGERVVKTSLEKSKTQDYELELKELPAIPIFAEISTVKNNFKIGSVGSFARPSQKIKVFGKTNARLIE